MPGTLRGDLLEGAAVGVAGLEIERVHLAGSAVHPQQDAGALAAGAAQRRRPRLRARAASRRPPGRPTRGAARRGATAPAPTVRAMFAAHGVAPSSMDRGWDAYPRSLVIQRELGAIEQRPENVGQGLLADPWRRRRRST